MNTRNSIRDPDSWVSPSQSRLRASASEIMHDLSLIKNSLSNAAIVKEMTCDPFSKRDLLSALLGLDSLIFETQLNSSLARIGKHCNRNKHTKCRLRTNSYKKCSENPKISGKSTLLSMRQAKQPVNGSDEHVCERLATSTLFGFAGKPREKQPRYRGTAHLAIAYFIANNQPLT